MDAAGFNTLVDEALGHKAVLYGQVLVQAALFRHGDVWRHALTRITPQPARIRARPRKMLVYDDVVLVDALWSLTEAREKLHEQVANGAIDIGAYRVAQPDPYYSEDHPRRVPSGNDYSDWPCTPIKIEPRDRMQLPERPLVSSARTFAGLHDAVREWVALRQYHDHQDARRGALLVVLPDYRLRITDVIPTAKGVEVRVERGSKLGQLTAHLVGHDRNGRIECKSRFTAKSAFFPTVSGVLDLQVFVACKDEQLDSYHETDYQHGVTGRATTGGPPREAAAGEEATMDDSAGRGSNAAKYDVAISFAGEDRAYAEAVVRGLKAADVTVFYDQDEAVKLWGDDLTVILDRVYRRDSRYVVVFVSQDYAAKIWPRREFRSALARAVEERAAYILPVRMDDTELEGLLPTISYMDGRRMTPDELVQAILVKLGSSSGPAADMDRQVRVPRRASADFDPYAEAEAALEYLKRELTARAAVLRQQGLTASIRDQRGRFTLRVLAAGKLTYVFEVWLGDGRETSTLCFSDGHREPASSTSTTATATPEWDKASNRTILRGTNFSLLGSIGGVIAMAQDELVDAIWDKLCDVVERAR